MSESIRADLLRLLRVPPSPDPPAGSAESTQVFHAGRNFYTWSVLMWLVVEFCIALGLTGFVVSLGLAITNGRMPGVVRILLTALLAILVAAYVIQLPLTFFALRLGYEMRWYIVTDRSLRIRTGVWSVEELTMTFANIQQISVKQGPLQRILGIADVQVVSAGGSGGGKPGEKHKDGHAGNFEGVDNADSIRDLILERLRHYKDSGLGDPDHRDETPPAVTAAKELLEETRLLRTAFTSRS